MAKRPLSDFHPRERLASVPHTTRRFACRSALAASPDGETLAVVLDQGAGTYEAWTLPATGGKPQRAITVESSAVRSLCWSANGARLLVMRVSDNTTQDLLVVDPHNGDAREITRHAEDNSHIPAGWLADGRAVVITDEGSDHLWLGALDVATGKYEAIDRPDWDVELAASSADGRTQIWSVNDDGYSTLRWRVGSGPIRERRLDRAACEDLVISADGSRAAFTRLSPIEPWQVWTLDTATGDARIALGSTFAVPKSELVEPELIRIPGPDGDIPCFVYRPGAVRGPTPAILYPHGGPEGQSRPAFSAHLTHLAALIHRGLALVVPNIHGSTGYGRKWQAALHQDQ